MKLSLATLGDRLLAGLTGDAEHAEGGRPMLHLDMLSDWLPYRVFDPESRLYVNARSKGFVLAVTFGFFALCVAYVALCDRIIGPDPVLGADDPDQATTTAARPLPNEVTA